MQLTLTPNIPALPVPITYSDRLLLIGSCFSENMYDRLVLHKFRTLSNPHGILFNPLSVAQSLDNYIDGKVYTQGELFYLNELWNSWDHHTRFSDVDANTALDKINGSQQTATAFIRTATHVIITLGSAFQYYLVANGKHVANNHRAPSQWFEKRLLPVTEIIASLNNTLDRLKELNPGITVIFTISPVRHIRDGVVDNNRSKARLIESVHELCSLFPRSYYFPAYELVIDILRDYRYYDIDFVHPNYLATGFVWEQFIQACMDSGTRELMKQVQEITTARNHRTRFPQTAAHRKFMTAYADKTAQLATRLPQLDFTDELAYFREV